MGLTENVDLSKVPREVMEGIMRLLGKRCFGQRERQVQRA